jgi:lipopolysaccharide/colanic/teichoic acid biosynthesis glycosyltransferase
MTLSSHLDGILKRTFDLIVSGIALFLLAPLIATLWLVVKMTSSGPGFFRQVRVGRYGKEFTLIKFRTMIQHQGVGKPLVTGKDDPRITAAGRFLRATKLDELPELWNVFIGDMSLVGYRPEVPRFVKHYHPEWGRVLAVRPGLTDPLTFELLDEEALLDGVSDREAAYIEVLLPIKMERILHYVDNRTFVHDLHIGLRTVWAITFGRKSRPTDNDRTRTARKKITEWETARK